MAEQLPDDALARALQQMGIAALDQIELARAIQNEQTRNGRPVSLADILLQQGIITAAIIENVTKHVQARAAAGIKQLGQYKLIKMIGEGAMGQVYLAEDTHVGRMVAVKVLPKKFSDDPQFLTRFRREAQATGKLNHLNIVCAYTVSEENGVHYYAMEYCDGVPLSSVIKKTPSIPWELATDVMMQAARGLKHAHEHGIIHRDIKPDNIFICRGPGTSAVPTGSPLDILGDGYVAKILDLGLSKDLGGESSSFYTQTGMAMGTPHYISPEQARGEAVVDGRTDIYSLGATYYHLVTGQTPFTGTTAAVVMMKHLEEQLPNPQDVNEDIPDSVAQVIVRMMAKDPADRYANCKELLEDLELIIDGKMPSSPALVVEKSSVALARVKRHRPGGTGTSGRSAARGTTRGPVPPVGTRRHESAGRAHHPADRPNDKRHGTARQARVPPPLGAAQRKRYVLPAAGVGAVLLVVILLLLPPGTPPPEAKHEVPDAETKTSSKPETTKPVKAGQTGSTTTGSTPVVKAEPPKFNPDLSAAVDLLPMIAPDTAVNGRWAVRDGALISEWHYETSVLIPWRPPEEYDFRVEFARQGGNEYVSQHLYAFGRSFRWLIGAAGNTWYTFDPVAGKLQNNTTVTVAACLENGKRYVSHVQVRKNGIKAYVDGKLIRDCPLNDYANFGTDLKSQEPPVLGLGSNGSPTIFYSAKVIEITGKGKPIDVPWTRPAKVDDAFVRALDALPPNEQFQRIVLRLQDFNPGYNGAGSSTVQAGLLVGINLPAGRITNLAPLRAVPWISALTCSGGRIRSNVFWDLSPIEGLELTEADFSNTNVIDLSPLQGMKLRSLKVANTPLTDLSPLTGMPLVFLDCSSTLVGSLSPLSGMALTGLACNNTQVRDLSPLKGMLLTKLECSEAPVSDLRPLAGMPLERLGLYATQVKDLSPLRGMPLTSLDIRGLQLTDLSALKDFPLQTLSLDFEPKRDMATLKAIKTLEQINGVNAAEFLQKAGK